MWQEKILKASNRFEEISILARVILSDLREDAPRDQAAMAYARVYLLRRELGRVVAGLGGGVPSELKRVEKEYREYLED